MSPRFTAAVCCFFERESQKRITECHNLIMYLRMSCYVCAVWKSCIPIMVLLFVFFSRTLFFRFTLAPLVIFFPITLISSLLTPALPVLSLILSPPCPFFLSRCSSHLLTITLIHRSSASLFYIDRWQSSWATMSMCQRR